MSVKVLSTSTLASGRPNVDVRLVERDTGSSGGRTSSHVDPAAPGADDDGGLEAQEMPEVFDRVYGEHFAFVWRTLRLLGVEPAALEDAAQDVFAVVSRQLPDFAERSSLRTWIFAIVQRTAANYRRKHRRKLKPLVPFNDLAGHEPTPQAHAEAFEAAQIIERFSESLTADRRAVFVLSLLEELPAAEVARALELPVNTVYTRIRALRAGLERALANGAGDDDG